MENQKKLFVIDGMSLLFRSFYAMSQSRLSLADGTPVGAVFGFLKVIIKILKDHSPTHFAVCWDLKDKTFRHEHYHLYKSNRGETPPDLIPQIHLIKELVLEMGIPSFSLSGYEADDIAGTLAHFFFPYGQTYLVTLDKDYMQLVNDKVFMFSLKKGDDYDVLDAQKVVDYFGVLPEKVIDLLALTGDPIDCVPGVKGVGDKTAAKLILEYGSLEALYEQINTVSNKRARENLMANQENAFLSKFLVTIKKDVPVILSEESLIYSFTSLCNKKEFKTKLESLNMKSISKSIFGDEDQSLAPSLLEGGPMETDWHQNDCLITTKAELLDVLSLIQNPKTEFFSIDTETTGLDIIEDKPIGFSLCFDGIQSYYIPTDPCHLANEIDFSAKEAFSLLNESLKNRKSILVAHNLKFDLHMFRNVGVDLTTGPLACSMVAAWLSNPSEPDGFSLDALTLKYLNFQKIPTSALMGKGTSYQNMKEVPLEKVFPYACEDVQATWKLWTLFFARLNEQKDIKDIYFQIEMPLLVILASMEEHGAYLNTDYLSSLAVEVQEQLKKIETDIYQLAGEEFSISSPKQLGRILFDVVKVHEQMNFKGTLAKTTLGYKTDAAVLEQFEEHPFVNLIQQYRELSKLLSTYILALPKLVKSKTKRLHTSYHQIGTVTGRLSSSHPNLQNVPIRTELGKKVRAAFCSENHSNVLISADYSQIELRVLAHLSKDEELIRAFLNGVDIHRQTAAQILEKPLEEVSKDERSHAKAINFGILYGMGYQRLAKTEKISNQQAKVFIEKYFQSFPNIKNYLNAQKSFALEHGYVKNYFGRLRPLPQIHSKNKMEAKFAENMAINTPIQGTASDVMKLGMIAVFEKIKSLNLKTKMILQVHDELVLESPHEEKDLVLSLVKEAMEQAVSFVVPMSVDIHIGTNWLEAK